MPVGPRLRRGLAVGVAIAALTPASALAQGAGDDEYSDPFGSDSEQATPAPAPRAPAATVAPAPAQAAATPAPAQPGPAAAPAPPGAPRLPYTGSEGWLTAAGGALLLGAGLTLRARLREPD